MTREDCYFYFEEHDMGARIPCCTRHEGLGNCPCDGCEKYLTKADAARIINKYCDGKLVEPCEDAISRQAVKSLPRLITDLDISTKTLTESVDIKMIESLPSVAPKPKTDVLDKVRAEFINEYPKNYAGEPEFGGYVGFFSLNRVLEIIDKCRAESEEGQQA
jgi:hypothetical protein